MLVLIFNDLVTGVQALVEGEDSFTSESYDFGERGVGGEAVLGGETVDYIVVAFAGNKPRQLGGGRHFNEGQVCVCWCVEVGFVSKMRVGEGAAALAMLKWVGERETRVISHAVLASTIGITTTTTINTSFSNGPQYATWRPRSLTSPPHG